MNADRLKELAGELVGLLKLRTLPIGLRLFEDLAEMERVPGLRRPPAGKHFSTCQLVTQARIGGQTLAITEEALLPFMACGAVVGLKEVPEFFASGEAMAGVWFENQEAAHQHQAQMPRVAAGRYKGLVASPLRMGRLDPPDIVLFYANPAQMILFINGLQWKNYRRLDFSVTGETACADSWGRALATRAVSLSIPCFAERRYGGVADDELLMALPPEELETAIEGLKGLDRAGLRYPILPYGPNSDPGEGLAASYGGRSAKPAAPAPV
jgi:uncharacterized protein (DUF169 family)